MGRCLGWCLSEPLITVGLGSHRGTFIGCLTLAFAHISLSLSFLISKMVMRTAWTAQDRRENSLHMKHRARDSGAQLVAHGKYYIDDGQLDAISPSLDL